MLFEGDETLRVTLAIVEQATTRSDDLGHEWRAFHSSNHRLRVATKNWAGLKVLRWGVARASWTRSDKIQEDRIETGVGASK